VVRVESARDMLAACERALPVDVAVCAAAVADWRPETVARDKFKKGAKAKPPQLKLVENPDVLAALCASGNRRPRLVIGFAAETKNVVAGAVAKRKSKGCDWMVANDVSPATGVLAGDSNTVHLITADGVEDWPRLAKTAVAERLAARVARALKPS
jgi:phosphopantothenoylcysteine decarboxylase/phosphopantothenate--cysteine ligase